MGVFIRDLPATYQTNTNGSIKIIFNSSNIIANPNREDNSIFIKFEYMTTYIPGVSDKPESSRCSGLNLFIQDSGWQHSIQLNPYASSAESFKRVGMITRVNLGYYTLPDWCFDRQVTMYFGWFIDSYSANGTDRLQVKLYRYQLFQTVSSGDRTFNENFRDPNYPFDYYNKILTYGKISDYYRSHVPGVACTNGTKISYNNLGVGDQYRGDCIPLAMCSQAIEYNGNIYRPESYLRLKAYGNTFYLLKYSGASKTIRLGFKLIFTFTIEMTPYKVNGSSTDIDYDPNYIYISQPPRLEVYNDSPYTINFGYMDNFYDVYVSRTEGNGVGCNAYEYEGSGNVSYDNIAITSIPSGSHKNVELDERNIGTEHKFEIGTIFNDDIGHIKALPPNTLNLWLEFDDSENKCFEIYGSGIDYTRIYVNPFSEYYENPQPYPKYLYTNDDQYVTFPFDGSYIWKEYKV